MHRTLIVAATIGWSPYLLTAPLSARLTPYDRVALILYAIDPSGDSLAENRLKETLNEINHFTQLVDKIEQPLTTLLPRPEYIEDPIPSYAEHIATKTSETLERIQATELDIIAAGGPRPLVVAATLLGSLSSHACSKIKASTVFEDTRKEIQTPPIPLNMPAGETKTRIASLAARTPEGLTYREIARELGIDESTVRRLAQELARKGLLNCSHQRSRIVCRPTPTLRLLHAAKHLAETTCRRNQPKPSNT